MVKAQAALGLSAARFCERARAGCSGPFLVILRRYSSYACREMTGDAQNSEPKGLAHRIGQLIAVLLMIAIPIGIVLLAIGMFPADLPEKGSPSFIDTIFDNRGVVWAARLLLVSAAGVLAVGGIFIVGSTVIRMKNEEWLRRAGPFEISETAVSEIEGQVEFWREAALAGQEEVAELTDRLEESDELIEQLHDMLDDG